MTTSPRADTNARTPCRAISRLLALPQHLAHADLDGHRAGAAVPARARRDPRRAAAAAQPQRGQGRRSTSPSTRSIGPWLDRLQAFDVFSSFWFTAIYVLLFISLVGCLTPRLLEHVRSLRATPGAPRRATWPGCPSTTTAEVPGDAATPSPRMSSQRLRGWRRRHPHATATPSRSPPRRATCASSATSSSTSRCSACWSRWPPASCSATRATSSSSPTAGPGFCSASPAAFDSFRAGNTVDGTSLYPICLRVNDFEATLPAAAGRR